MITSKSERLGALENATGTFGHNDQNFHNTEIEAGADVALVKSLIFLQFKASFHRDSIDRDVEAITKEKTMILKCLECVYRYVLTKNCYGMSKEVNTATCHRSNFTFHSVPLFLFPTELLRML